ncbi:peptidylprolyl isomerase fpr3 [Coemansia sp. RSA 2050]|nr:peptidylprolyl isomerase fpr3 [Coemansia sp. RSA 2050]KAJ2733651.1 peptidylprolyl isomerase fpr3 [Coemansia sp. BCRC 34962]
MFIGFWGLKIVPGKTYTQTVDAAFRVSNASLSEEIANQSRTSVVLTVHQKRFVLCSLTPGKIEQQTLDITLSEGEEITFETTGDNEIHLVGNFIAEEDDSDDDMYGSSGEEDGEDIDFDNITPEELQDLINRGMIDPSALQLGDDDSDEDYDSEDAETDDRIREVTEEEEEELAGEAMSEEEEPVVEVKIKKQADKKRKPVEEEKEQPATPAKQSKKAKQAEKKAKQQAEAAAASEKPKQNDKAKAKAKATTLQGGVVVETKTEGSGALAKKGQRVGMYYIGKLTNGKVFDQNTKGKPFWFRLGAGEVIKGWDTGIIGMKKGEERRLTIPGPMAYGSRGAPPDIPPHATLIFDIRLVEFK